MRYYTLTRKNKRFDIPIKMKLVVVFVRRRWMIFFLLQSYYITGFIIVDLNFENLFSFSSFFTYFWFWNSVNYINFNNSKYLFLSLSVSFSLTNNYLYE